MEQETVMKKTLLTTLAVASSLAFACVANASENNPFGLVYKGAIMENVKGKVNIHPTHDCLQPDNTEIPLIHYYQPDNTVQIYCYRIYYHHEEWSSSQQLLSYV